MPDTKRGQLSLEYAVLIACIVLGVTAIRGYVIRSIQGKYKNTADSIGEQYAPGKVTSDITDTFSSDITTTTITETIDALNNTATTVIAESTPQIDPNTGAVLARIPELHKREGTETITP